MQSAQGLHQARTQTFEKVGENFRYFTRGANLKKIPMLEPKLGVNSVSGEKLHDFEIICLSA